jgi:hypothetical protein
MSNPSTRGVPFGRRSPLYGVLIPRRYTGGGADPKMSDNPVNPMPIWHINLLRAEAAPRSGARNRAGNSCRSPAMANGRCRLHGGRSPGAPRGEGQGMWKHGRRSAGDNRASQENDSRDAEDTKRDTRTGLASTLRPIYRCRATPTDSWCIRTGDMLRCGMITYTVIAALMKRAFTSKSAAAKTTARPSSASTPKATRTPGLSMTSG